MAPRTVLIVGGAGFIGSHTADSLLALGHNVRVLDCLDPQVHGPSGRFPAYMASSIDMRRGDVRDMDAVVGALEGVDTVYHLAARTSTARSMYQMRDHVDVNVTGTATLWDAIAARGGVERVVLASSRAVYGEGAYRCEACGPVMPAGRSQAQLDDGLWDPRCPRCGASATCIATAEPQPPAPQSVYGATKLYQEQLSARAAATLGVALVVLRYFNVYGPRQALGNAYTGIANVFCARRLDGLPIELFEDGQPIRDFVSVHDVARANLLALSSAPPSGPVNVGSGVATTIREMAQAICRGLGLDPLIEVTGWSRVGDIRSCFADARMARETLGWRTEVELDAGIAELVRWVCGEERQGGAYAAMLEEIRGNGVLRVAATS
ncbi:NAD-dependent epimerase/dehydratase family protein [Chelatococcus reniformis]|uniref:Nucleoside-diphosphate-sugar epimerase n=1 Tax=Chelatococcus reniformis TaxID=1494448 RepID=A0A916TWV8_9HYPH|nr:NAD-dependent epimerase/dehydratase family protein [Chelatococcus reniformis]GGC48615.1 nucleoside-diphosphate-sugar epimerase [Chelatococcus reniformis]